MSQLDCVQVTFRVYAVERWNGIRMRDSFWLFRILSDSEKFLESESVRQWDVD